jgi:hypothetical protein
MKILSKKQAFDENYYCEIKNIIQKKFSVFSAIGAITINFPNILCD